MSAVSDLVAEVKKRRTQDLLGLSNPDDPTASNIDDTLLTNAATWAIAKFKSRTGRSLDSTSDLHLTAGVHLTMGYLFNNVGNITRAEKEYNHADTIVEDIKKRRFILYQKSDFERNTDDDVFNSDFENLFGGRGV